MDRKAEDSDYNYKAPEEHAADTGSSGSSAPANDPSVRVNRTPIIVGTVVGVIGGLAALGLLCWLWWRRSQRQAQREASLQPRSYTLGPSSGVEELPKGGLGEPSNDGQHSPDTPPISVAQLHQGTSASGQAAAEGHLPQRRILQEEDAEDVVEILPPRYRQRDYPEPGLSVPPTPEESPGLLVSSSSDSGQETDDRTARAWRPPLKTAYERAFISLPRTIPAGPRPLGDIKRIASVDLPGDAVAAVEAHPGALRMEYKRAFGSDSTRNHLPNRPSTASEEQCGKSGFKQDDLSSRTSETSSGR